MKETYYELDPIERWVRFYKKSTVQDIYLMPFDPLDPRKITGLSLHISEVMSFMQAIFSMSFGLVREPLFNFKIGLLSSASEHGPKWHTAVLLWCALFSIYDCDPLPALDYVAQAKEKSPAGETFEVRLIEGMAKRLSGDVVGAVDNFRLALEHSGRNPFYKDVAQAWMVESGIVAGSEQITEQQIKPLEEMDKTSHSYIGILPGTLFRMLATSGLQPEGVRTPEEILAALDNIHPTERPMLTMLLRDILPRPLKGVAEAIGSRDENPMGF